MKKFLLSFLIAVLSLTAAAQNINKAKMHAMYDRIKAAGIRHPEFVIAQCMQETGNLACKKCCLRYNNLFGFYVKGNKCKKFVSDEECIQYYKTWQDKRYDKWRKKNPKADYYHFLKSVGYATGDKYTAEIKPKVAWVKKNLKL
jgi:hypothetical protein